MPIYFAKSFLQTYLPPKVLFTLKYVKGNILSLSKIGKRFKCPICKGTFRKFLPLDAKKRKNAVCPRCGSLERQRLIWMYMKEKTRFFSSKIKVLHFAPEFCF